MSWLSKTVPRFSSKRAFASAVVPKPPSLPAFEDDLVEIVQATHRNQLEDEMTQYSHPKLNIGDVENLKSIKRHTVIDPSFFSMKGRLRTPIPTKRPYLGPPAAESRRRDIFYQLGIDPLRESLNPNLLSGYVTDMGRVNSRAETALTWRSQRRLSRAIKRSKMMGIIPLHSKRTLLYGY